MSNLLFSFNTVAPIFILVAIGWLARKMNLVGKTFVESASKLNFRTGLSALLFLSIYQQKGTDTFDWKFVCFMSAACLAIALILFLTIPRLVKDKSKASAMVHTIFKPNIIVLGFPIAVMMFGNGNVGPIAMILPALVPINNITAVLILSALDPENKNVKSNPIQKAFISVVKNPIIIAAISGIVFKQLAVPLPIFILKPLSSLSDMATPLALITLGAQMTMQSVLSNQKYVIIATALKTLVTPLILVPLAYFLGFRSYELAAAFLVFASPSAVNCYMLAREMHSDEVLTGEIVLSTTLCSLFVLFAGIFVLKTLAVLP
ncbi:MAG: AEC family transporter [Oscillospiraceae bacterium]|jgi:malate permease and related proteins